MIRLAKPENGIKGIFESISVYLLTGCTVATITFTILNIFLH